LHFITHAWLKASRAYFGKLSVLCLTYRHDTNPNIFLIGNLVHMLFRPTLILSLGSSGNTKLAGTIFKKKDKFSELGNIYKRKTLN